ncbi:hypothetical protein Q0M94_28360 (plasmid) [Deinococcus radiomollis]|uniref:hypothetical protein n=1 Tax=Deinococcus radiomollis TaxID=468916 RepID=UPI00389134BD
MSLRPGGGPAQLLLELWEAEQEHQGEAHDVPPCKEKRRLCDLRYITAGRSIQITEKGRDAARALEAGS